MTTIPPERFTVAYFRSVYKTPVEKEDPAYTLEREETVAAFRKTHRQPRVLSPGLERAIVCNLISCTCCILFSKAKSIHGCEDKNESIIEKVKQAKEHNESYDLVFVRYDDKNKKHDDIDKLVHEISEISPETKVFLLFIMYGDPKELRNKGYFAISRMEMQIDRLYDMIIAEALGDEGIKALELEKA